MAIILIPFRAIYGAAAAAATPLACAQRPSPTTAQQMQNKAEKEREAEGKKGEERELCVNDRIKRNPNINYALINFIYLTDFVAYFLHFYFISMVL